MKLDDLYERATIGPDSRALRVLDKHKKETDRFGGPVTVSIVRGNQISASVGDFGDENRHWVKASITSGNKWKVKEARGEMVEKVVKGKKTITEEQMVQALEAVFAAAKKYHK